MDSVRRFWRRRFNKVQKRHILVVTMCLVIFSNHSVRFTILELTQNFVLQANISATQDICNLSTPGATPLPQHRELPWHHRDAATIFDAYDKCYYASQLVAGIITDKRNIGRRLVLVVMCTHTVMTMVFPAMVENVKGYWQVVVAWSVVLGLLHGAAAPTLLGILGQWIPRGEKTITVAGTGAVVSVAYAINRLLGKYFLTTLERWATIVYIFGSISALSSLLWFCFCYTTPETHPTITPEEKNYLRRKIGPYYEHKTKTIPWLKMLKSLPFWAIIVNLIGTSITWYTITVEYAGYLYNIVKMDFKRAAPYYYARPNALLVVTTILASLSCDFLIKRELVHITTVRKMYNNIGSMGALCFAVTATYAYCNHDLSVALYSVILPFVCLYYTGAVVNILDIAPNFAGTIQGIATTFSLIIRMVRPLATAKWIKENSYSGWRYTFWFALATCTVTDIFYVLFCQGTEQRWNIPQDLRNKREFQLYSIS